MSSGRLLTALAGVALAALTLSACGGSPDGRRLYAAGAKLDLAIGRMRSEVAPDDAPYDAQKLAQHFTMVVFDQEKQLIELGRTTADAVERVSKWQRPVYYRLVGDDVRPEDHQAMLRLAARLSAATNLSITAAAPHQTTNMTIMVLTPEARTDLMESYADDKRFNDGMLSDWTKRLSIPCAGTIFSRSQDADDEAFGGEITGAFLYIKAETEGLYRESCFHEEVAQAFGLTNDHPEVRPSIFNDDNEFALLTEHDEMLLRILYDPRIKAGMSRAEAAPLAREIAQELRPDP
ncbi:MAG: DUF2927 domain-containing protein [Rhodobacteraceae bacterium]|nr:DUF2927 domain-containing protein [Paracoccaceae bacterium]